MNIRLTPLMMTLIATLFLAITIILAYLGKIETKTVLILLGCAVFVFMFGKVIENSMLKKQNAELKKEIELLRKELDNLKK